MSRFFVSGYLDSSSEEEDLLSTSEEELLSLSDDSDLDFPSLDDDSDLDSLDDDGFRALGPAYFLKKQFLKGAGGDLDSDDEGRQAVRSAKDKLADEIKAVAELINVARRQNNFTTVLSEFEKLNKLVTKAHNALGWVPNEFVKCLGGLELCIDEVIENEKLEKTLNAAEAKAFNTVRQRVRKTVREHQKLYNAYLDDPDAFDADEPVKLVLEALPAPAPEQLEGHPVFTVLKAIAETRGKKNIDKYEQIAQVELLLAEHPDAPVYDKICLYQMLLSIRFDLATHQQYMPMGLWNLNVADLHRLLALLEESKSTYQLLDTGVVTDEVDIEPEANAEGVRVVFGLIALLVDRLDDEFTRSLQNTDPHLMEYVARLKDEARVYQLVVRGQQYIELITEASARAGSEQLGRIVARRLEHVYYKPDRVIEALEKAAAEAVHTPAPELARALVEQLVGYLEGHANPQYPQEALLLLIYYYAVNNHYAHAKQLFVQLAIYNHINGLELQLQVAYNRALVQLGLLGFRQGEITELHRILNEIVNLQRLKELLGQGFNYKYPSQATNAEKQKLLPFHMHINLELLECVYMTLLLLLEIPQLAAADKETAPKKLKLLPKLFKLKLEFHERQFFTGPPELIKDHIVYALIALQKGNWTKAYQLLLLIKIWRLFADNDQLMAMLKHQLQIEGLRTYVFTYRTIYTKLLISKLATIFDLPRAQVDEIVGAMVGDQLAARVDGDFIIFTLNEPQRTRLQELAIVMNEKVGLLKEKNEKTQLNGYGKKPPQQKEAKEAVAAPQEADDNKFRYANVNSNNDEFQSL